MFEFFRSLFDTTGFPARWHCGSWSDTHGWVHIISDLAIFGAYFAIPLILAFFVKKRKDLPFPPVVLLFAGFILSCGIGHAIEATIFWNPWYRLSGAVKMLTALISWATVIALIPIIPKALSLPGLAAMNDQLKQEIARREQAEEERRQLEAQMLQAQKLESLGVLAGGIAHDFNNLLTSILGYADLAREPLPADSDTRSLLDQVISGAQRAAELTNQMLAYSGKGRFVVEPVRLADLVDSMNRLLNVSVTKKAVVKHEASPDQPPIHADLTQLRQVVMNLIINASEAIGDHDGEIRVRTGRMYCNRIDLAGTYLDEKLPEGDYAYLEVTDTGNGMPDDIKAKIFDPFFTTKFTGRGLGLAAVLGIVRGHRGAIRVESTPGKGTSFRIYFPVTGDPAPNVVRRVSNDSVWRGSGTILVVDDEETVRTMAREMLQVLGFTVVEATNGVEGVERFRENPSRFTLVLLDLTMPQLDGADAFREMQAIRPDVRAILMSGYSEQTVKPRFADQGLAGFLQKPFRLDELRRLIRSVLES